MADSPKTIPALKIRAVPTKGFYRAGRHWVPEPQVVPLSDFDKKQIAALRAEPNLVVEDAEIPPKPAEA